MSNFSMDTYKMEQAIGKMRNVKEHLSVRPIFVAGKQTQLENYSGMGIENIRNAIDLKAKDLIKIYKEVHQEYIALESILNKVKKAEFDVFKIHAMITISHDDMGDLVDELKYYSQNNDRFPDVYQKFFVDRYKKGGDVKLTWREYQQLHDLYDLLKTSKSGNYSYKSCYAAKNFEDMMTNPELVKFEDGKKPKKEIKLKYKNMGQSDENINGEIRKGVQQKTEYETKVLKLEYARKYDIGNTGMKGVQIQELYLDTTKISVELNFQPGISDKMFEKLHDCKNADDVVSVLNEALGLNLDIGLSETAFIYKDSVTGTDTNGNGWYSDIQVTAGELAAKAKADLTEVDFKLGATIAKTETTAGIVKNGEKIGAKGSALIGVEGSVKIGRDGKKKGLNLDAGFFGLGVEYEPASSDSEYVWLSEDQFFGTM